MEALQLKKVAGTSMLTGKYNESRLFEKKKKKIKEVLHDGFLLIPNCSLLYLHFNDVNSLKRLLVNYLNIYFVGLHITD